MRRIGAILLLTIFLTPTLGFCIHKHYCGDYLKEVNFFVDANEDNCCGSQEEIAGCCSDEELIYQLDIDYSANIKVEVVIPAFTCLAKAYAASITDEITEDFSSYLHYKPPLLFQDISILVQSFLI
ncbi:MAG: hypothetical protein JKY53_08700 [Flavobacteriales bacterium]|nr:hypothetical protein [Flavobacteriales bacterium]